MQKPLKEDFNSSVWVELITKIKMPTSNNEIHLITSGKRDKDYFTKVREFNIENTYENNGEIIERIREEWKSKYDFILIDSRTGITDYGGICTVHLPDILLLFYVTTAQSLDGIIDLYNKAKVSIKKLPFDRKSLIALPILSRFDSSEEYKISQEWIERSSKKLSEVYKNWLPKEINMKDFIELTKIPYIPYFSFGEKLAVIEQSSKDPTGMVYAYETLSAIIADRLENVSNVIKNRDAYIREQDRSLKEKSILESSKKKVFISYANEDKYLATELYNKLIDLGFDPWIDVKDIKQGEVIQNTQKKSISDSDIFLSIVTKNYNENKKNILEEINYALDTNQTKFNKRFMIVPLIFEKTKIPQGISDFQSFDFSKTKNFDEFISFVQPEYKSYQYNWSIEVEEKWLSILEEKNEIKIKRQIFNLKDTLNDCFYEILELDRKEVSASIRKRFWDSINTVCLQILVIIRYDLVEYLDDLFNILIDTYSQSVGPYSNLISDEPKGKQAEIWFGIIIRIYFMGAAALNYSRYKIVRKLINVKPLPGYWSKNFWIRHAQVMFARKKNERDTNGVVFYANSYLQEFYWIHRFLDPKDENTLNRLCEFDFLQCVLSFKEYNDNWACYPSFGQFYNWRLEKVLNEITTKNKSYEIVRDIPDNKLADIIIKLDKYAEKENGYISGYDSNSFSPDVKNFLEKNRTKLNNE